MNANMHAQAAPAPAIPTKSLDSTKAFIAKVKGTLDLLQTSQHTCQGHTEAGVHLGLKSYQGGATAPTARMLAESVQALRRLSKGPNDTLGIRIV